MRGAAGGSLECFHMDRFSQGDEVILTLEDALGVSTATVFVRGIRGPVSARAFEDVSPGRASEAQSNRREEKRAVASAYKPNSSPHNTGNWMKLLRKEMQL